MTTGILVANFGGPQSPDELVPFLSRLLADVLPGPQWVTRPAGAALARLRAPKVRPNYEDIGWSPLVPTHEEQIAALRAELGPDAPPIDSGMMFTAPEFGDALRRLRDRGVDQLVVLPMFPHYSLATTNAAYEFLWEAMVDQDLEEMPVHWVPAYPNHPMYVEALAETIRKGVASTPGEAPLHLLFSPHGLPLSFVERGDPYPDQIRQSVQEVLSHLDWQGPWHIGWQSKVGPVKWLTPGTPEVLESLARDGVRRVCVVPLSFVSDHIETLDEIDREYRELAHELGIPHFGRAPAMNLEPAFIRCLADLARDGMAHFEVYRCVRCLEEKTRAHRDRHHCPTCAFTTPTYLKGSHSHPLGVTHTP